MVYAQIKNNVVQNIIVLEDMSLRSVFAEGYDLLNRVDQLITYPSPGDIYDPNTDTYSKPDVG